jgi:hypothetical protein
MIALSLLAACKTSATETVRVELVEAPATVIAGRAFPQLVTRVRFTDHFGQDVTPQVMDDLGPPLITVALKRAFDADEDEAKLRGTVELESDSDFSATFSDLVIDDPGTYVLELSCTACNQITESDVLTVTAPVIESNVGDGYFLDPLATPLTISGIPTDKTSVDVALVAEAPLPAWVKDVPALRSLLLPALKATLSGGTITIGDPPVLSMTGTFRFALPKMTATAPFTIAARHAAYAQCLDATVLAGASTQTPLPFRARIGSCTMSRSGGDNVAKVIAHASCSTAKGTSVCDYDASVSSCSGAAAPPSERRAAGDAVTLSWSGGDVPAGSVNVTVPAALELGAPPSTHVIGNALEVTYSGSGAGEVRMTLSQTVTGSQVSVDCTAPIAAGKVVMPAEMFLMLEPGAADLLFSVSGTQVVRSGAWEIEASAPGVVNRGGVTADPSYPLLIQAP